MYSPEDSLSLFLKLTLEKARPSGLTANSSSTVNPDTNNPTSNIHFGRESGSYSGGGRQMGKYNCNQMAGKCIVKPEAGHIEGQTGHHPESRLTLCPHPSELPRKIFQDT